MFNASGNLSKIGKISRLIRLTKLLRLIKMLNLRSTFLKTLADKLKISAGTRRLFFLSLVLLLLQHAFSCVWYVPTKPSLKSICDFRIIIAQLNSDSKTTWVYEKGYIDMGDLELYITSFYFTVTTLMTVGYGDITAYSIPEKIVCIFLMLIGVVAFSFATGYISSIITNQDSVEARMNEKMGTLEILRDEYGLDKELFIRVLNTVKFDLKQNSSRDVLDFI
jgi:hypothetical protein